MSQPHWADRLDNELARRGVGCRYRQRLVAELLDHADDLVTREGLTMTEDVLNERMGTPAALAALAAQAAEEYRRSRWTSRHPLVVFGLLPLPATLLAFVLNGLLLVLLELVAYVIGSALAVDFENLPRASLVAIVYACAWSFRFLPFVLLAFLFTRLYLRARVNRWWYVVAATQILFVAGTVISAIRYSEEPGQSAWLIGFTWATVPPGEWYPPLPYLFGWGQVLQVIVPVAVAAQLFRIARRRQAALTAG
jgi:hypothetical protein